VYVPGAVMKTSSPATGTLAGSQLAARFQLPLAAFFQDTGSAAAMTGSIHPAIPQLAETNALARIGAPFRSYGSGAAVPPLR